MIILYIILAVLFFLIVWLLFAPLIIYVDSGEGLYYVKIPLLIKLRFVIDDGQYVLRFRIFFIPFDVKTGKKKITEKDDRKERKRRKKKHRINKILKVIPAFLKFLPGLFRTSRIKKMIINFDTGDYTINARLVPVLAILSRKNISLNVNYSDINTIHLIIQNRLFNIVRLGVSLFLKIIRA